MGRQDFKFYFCLLLITVCCLDINAQEVKKTQPVHATFSEDFIHHAKELYDWNAIEIALAKRLNIHQADCNNFLMYLYKGGFIHLTEYLEKVEDGSVTASNADQYWINQFPAFENLYTTEKVNFEHALAAVNIPSSNVQLGARASCSNLDFTSGVSGWTGSYNNTKSQVYNTAPLSLPVQNLGSGIHELMSSGNDPYCPISKVPPGHSASLRLGNDGAFTMGSAYPYNHQMIRKTFTVSAANPTVTYWYAIVFSQASSNPHGKSEQPYFKIRMFDKNNTEIECASYDVDATSGANGGFQIKSMGSFSGSEAVYKDWVPVFIPLINFVNQQVTIQFESSDCRQGGHMGYAYLAVDCGPFEAVITKPFACGGTTAEISAPAGANKYEWSGPGVVPPNSTKTITINKAGKYTVKMSVIGNGGIACYYSLDVDVSSNITLPVANFTAPTVCLGQPTKFTDTSTPKGNITSWSWDFNGDGVEDSKDQNPSYTFTTTGTFPVKLNVDAGGCKATVTKDVIVGTLPDLKITDPAPVCLPATIDITAASITTGSSSGGTLSYWSDAAGTIALANPAAINSSGTYYIKYATGTCADIKPVVVTFSVSPVLTITSPLAVCDPTTVDITAAAVTAGTVGTGTLTYWSDAAGTIALTNPSAIAASGTYYIKSTAGICSDMKPVVVVINPVPTLVITAPPAVCLPNTVDITASSVIAGSTGAGALSYWSDAAGTVALTNPAAIATSGTYYIKSTAAICFDIKPVVVTIYAVPELIITSPPAVCVPNTVDLTSVLITTGSTSGGTYSYWQDANATIPLTSPNAISASGTYYIKTVLTGGCMGIKPVVAVINSLPVSDAGPDVIICTGTDATIGAAAKPDYLYLWTPSTGLSSNSVSNPVVTLVNPGKSAMKADYVVTTINSVTGCATRDTMHVVVHVVATVNAGYAKTVCPGSSVKLEGSIGGSAARATWSGGAGTFSDAAKLACIYTPTVEEYAAGSVKLTLTTDDPEGPCSFASSDVTLTFYKNPVINFTVDKKDGCPIHCVSFSDSSKIAGTTDVIDKWRWDFGDLGSSYNTSNIGNPQHCYENPGFYDVTLTVTSNQGCVSKLVKPKMIHVFEMPVAEFFPTSDLLTVYNTEVKLVNGSSADVVYWNYHFGDGDSVAPKVLSPTHKYPVTGGVSYLATLLVKNADGCISTVEHLIHVEPEFSFYIPNAFTPNGDNNNDGFSGRAEGVTKYDFIILDRWGNLMFHTKNLDDKWNGKVYNESDVAQQDVYVWKVKLTDVFNKVHEYIGTVTLVR